MCVCGVGSTCIRGDGLMMFPVAVEMRAVRARCSALAECRTLRTHTHTHTHTHTRHGATRSHRRRIATTHAGALMHHSYTRCSNKLSCHVMSRHRAHLQIHV